MNSNHLFKQRLTLQWQTFTKYLNYVFNDHAVIAFFFLFGAILFAYQQLLSTLPITWWSQLAVVGLITMTLFLFKKPATLIKPADPVFFLGNERLLIKLWHSSIRYSMVVNAVIQGGLVLICWPLLFKLLTHNILIVSLLSLGLMVMKAYITYQIAQRTARFNAKSSLINWSAIAQAEAQRLASIYHFFNLFIDVPGLTNQVNVHPQLEKIRRFWPGHKKQPLVPLYVTTFLRKSPYLNLWVRMTGFGLLLVPFVEGWLLVILLLLLQYLFLIQLLPLVGSYRRLAFDSVIPINLNMRKKAFHALSIPLLLTMTGSWTVLNIICHRTTPFLLIILVSFSLILVFWYSNYSINTMFKRRTTHASKK